MSSVIQTKELRTTWGTIGIGMVGNTVVSCELPFLQGEPTQPFALAAKADDPASRFIEALLSGKRAKRPAYALPEGTVFQRQVWQAIAEIPQGRTCTYADLARAIGRPKALRAVGTACGRNPLPLFIPCHRVVGSNGHLGGFSSGLAWKRRLLECEKKH